MNILNPDRSKQSGVRNPILLLPAAAKIAKLPLPVRQALRELLLEIHRDATARAKESWRKHKAPMAAYWKAVAVYAGHIARALK
jgi:hypothetical protein